MSLRKLLRNARRHVNYEIDSGVPVEPAAKFFCEPTPIDWQELPSVGIEEPDGDDS